jgi:hypothetical protein
MILRRKEEETTKSNNEAKAKLFDKVLKGKFNTPADLQSFIAQADASLRILKIKHWPLFRISNINLQSLQMTLHQFLLEPSPKTLLSMVYKPGLGMLAYYTPIVVKLAICIKIVLPSLFCHRSKLSFVLCFRRLYTRQIVQGLRSHLY